MISSVEKNNYPSFVYNLSVEENHNYYVGEEKILSHNMANIKNCSQGINGGDDHELKLISDYEYNDVFGKSVNFNAGDGGTGITYKVFQRNDIDWEMVRSTGAKKVED